MQGMEIAQNLKDKEEARRLMRKRERDAYDKMSPEQQADFIKKAPAQDLIDLGLADPIEKKDEPVGPPQPGAPTSRKEKKTARYDVEGLSVPWGVKLRPKPIRGKTLEEQGVEARAIADVNNAVAMSDLQRELLGQQVSQTQLQIKRGEFEYATDKVKEEQRQMWLKSGDPFLESLATGKPAAEHYENKLRKDFPDLAHRADQIKFNMGPEAQTAKRIEFYNEGMQLFQNHPDAEKYQQAMSKAMFTGDWSGISNLPRSMKTIAAKNLDVSYAQLALSKQQILSSEQQFLQRQAQQLVEASGWQLSMDTAVQWVKKNTYGEAVSGKMSPEAEAQVKGFQSIMEGQRQTAQASAFYDLRAKQGKDAREAREGLISSIRSLRELHKDEIGGKTVEQQMLLFKDELVKQQAAELGIDLNGSGGQFWTDSIWGAALSAAGGGVQLAVAATADKVAADTSLGGRIAGDVFKSVALNTLGQDNINKIAQGQELQGEQYAELGEMMSSIGEIVTNPEKASTVFSLSGTKLGNALQAAMKKVPGFRIAYQENLKSLLAQYKVEHAATTDNVVKADRMRKMQEMIAILEGMGVQ
jgi:hypothetical protein